MYIYIMTVLFIFYKETNFSIFILNFTNQFYNFIFTCFRPCYISHLLFICCIYIFSCHPCEEKMWSNSENGYSDFYKEPSSF